MNGRWLIQATESGETAAEAAFYLHHYAMQDGFEFGRVIGDGIVKPFTAQAFFADEPPESAERLPDGLRRVFVPASFERVIRARNARTKDGGK